MKRTTVIVGLIFVVLGGVTLALWTTRGASTVKFETPYQAVLLDNNQVYYGKVQGLGTPFPLSHRHADLLSAGGVAVFLLRLGDLMVAGPRRFSD